MSTADRVPRTRASPGACHCCGMPDSRDASSSWNASSSGSLANSMDVRRTIARLRSEQSVSAPAAPASPSGAAAAPEQPLDGACTPASTPRRAHCRAENRVRTIRRPLWCALHAVVTIVMGRRRAGLVGTAQGLLSPAVRVILGAVLAAGPAVAGLALRSRGEPPVRAYAARARPRRGARRGVGGGPDSSLCRRGYRWTPLPPGRHWHSRCWRLATRVSNCSRLALAAPSLPPFVQRSGAEHFLMLAAYGVTVASLALRTIVARPWQSVATIVVLAAFGYASGLARVSTPHVGSPASSRRAMPPCSRWRRWCLRGHRCGRWIALAFTTMIVATGGVHGLQSGTPPRVPAGYAPGRAADGDGRHDARARRRTRTAGRGPGLVAGGAVAPPWRSC